MRVASKCDNLFFMKNNDLKFDVIVAGAGTSGCAAAYHLSGLGLKTALLEKAPRTKAGPQHMNCILLWQFDEAGIPRPNADEAKLGRDGRVLVYTADGRLAMNLPRNPMTAIHMPTLTGRMQKLAMEAGAEIYDGASIESVELGESGRPAAVEAVIGKGKTRRAARFEARLFVDASGMEGAFRNRVPLIGATCPPVPEKHICYARQQVRRVTNEAAARKFLDGIGMEPEDFANYLGVAGGYSTLTFKIERDFDRMEILTGATLDRKAEGENADDIAERFIERHSDFIGDAMFGAPGRIPLRRPYDKLAEEGIALLGNSANMVFPAHGSGVGTGMMAAKILADCVKGYDDPGDREAMSDYCAAFQRRWGALLAVYDLFRRMSQDMSKEEVGDLLTLGILNKGSFYAGLDQRMPDASLEDLLETAAGAVKRPRLVAKAVPALARFPLVAALYKNYPGIKCEKAIKVWSKTAAALYGDEPDVK